MRFLIGIIIPTLTFTISAFAESSCANHENANELVECILSQSPTIKSSKLGQDVATASETTASQRPNLQFGGSGGPTKATSNNGSQFQLSLLHTFELGGKRSSRIEVARASISKSGAQVLEAIEEAKINVILSLVRLRQIEIERDYVQEAFTTLRKIRNAYQKRGSLSPDQEVAVENFELAAQTYELEKTQLGFEAKGILNQISLQAGSSFQPKVFPKPLLETTYSLNPTNDQPSGSRFLLPRYESEVAKAEVELAKSNSWPSLQIGPSFTNETLGTEKIESLGLSLSLTLPLYHQNQGERAEASSRWNQAQVQQNLKEREARLERDRLISIVEDTKKTLGELRSRSNSSKIHDKIHKLLDRGVLSSQSVIESHRQLVDSLKSYNERELQGIEATWRILALDGRLKMEKVQ